MSKNIKDKLSVGLCDLICPICGKKCDNVIIMNDRLTKKAAQEVEKAHGQTIGYANKPCKDCQEQIDNNKFILIEIDPNKTDDMKNPYRTGRLAYVDKDSDFYKNLNDQYKVREACFIDVETFNMITNNSNKNDK